MKEISVNIVNKQLEQATTLRLLDVTEQSHSPHGPMLRSDVAFKVDGPNVIEVCSSWFPVDRTLVQLRVFAGSGVDGVNVYYWHLLV